MKAPSLYHHFDDRAEIMAEVSRTIIQETMVPRGRKLEHWQDWLVAMCVNARKAILLHPNAAPILLEFVPRDVLSARYDDATKFIIDAGVSIEKITLLLDGMENLILGAGLVQAMKPAASRSRVFPHVDRKREPALSKAIDAARSIGTEEVFAETVRAFLRGAVAD